MKILNREPRSGKTMRMIYTSEVTGFRIVTPTREMAMHVERMAKELGSEIPAPASVEEFLDVKRHSARFDESGILIDEAESVIQNALEAFFRCPVRAVSISVEMAKHAPDGKDNIGRTEEKR